jgi:oligopeptide transport system substrate-binding protein
MNGRGLPAQSPIPPGIFGYEAGYVNPYRKVDLERAKRLMVEAGYPGGVDPSTGEALVLTFDSSDTTTAGLIRVRFFIEAWKKLGIDMKIEATNYNQFLEKLRNGAHQVFQAGWVADYPDPENFLFLLWSEMGQSKHGGPNATNFSSADFDTLFLAAKTRDNGPARMAEIRKMRTILERERPWIELFHREDYSLYHGWVRNVKPMGISTPTYQYRDIDVDERVLARREWNEPILWPAYVLVVALVLIVIPGVRTYLQERQ